MRRRRIVCAAAIAATAIAASCNFGFTILGSLNNRNDPLSREFADYTVEVVAGVGSGAIPDDGAATGLLLSEVQGMACAGGYLYLSDTLHNRVIRVDLDAGTAATIAGTGVPGYSGDGGQATAATLYQPASLAVSDSGSLYVYDYGNGAIRTVSPSGVIATFLDLAAWTDDTWDRSSLGAAEGHSSLSLAGDTLYFVLNDVVYAVPTGSGSSSTQSSDPSNYEFPKKGYWDGLFSDYWARSCVAAADGSVYVSAQDRDEYGMSLLAFRAGSTDVTSTGIEPNRDSTLAITSDDRIVFRSGFEAGVYAYHPAAGTSAAWTSNGIDSDVFCAGPSDELYWYNADYTTNHIAEGVYATPEAGTDTLIAGKEDKTASGAAAGGFVHPYDLAIDSGGTALYFTEYDEGTIRRVSLSDGEVTLLDTSTSPTGVVASPSIAGAVYCYGDELVQVTDLGAATTLYDRYSGYESIYPQYADIAIDSNGVLHAADNGNLVVKLEGSALSTVAGTSSMDISYTYETISSLSATSIRLEQLSGLAFSASGTLYTAEGCGRVLAVKDGVATRYAGGVTSAEYGFSGFADGDEFSKALDAGFNSPRDVACGTDGRVYIACSSYPGLLRVSAEGLIERLRADVGGKTADVYSNHGIAIDSAGRVYMPSGYQILRLTPRF
ncbi:MAG TPA: hypothetical protein P5298_08150 [Spirochaetia bacterium]|nr:hypothetical protein [Spirochaetales bacterium]HRW24367.1 hypothetical protein [Spirochaetia bacterium]